MSKLLPYTDLFDRTGYRFAEIIAYTHTDNKSNDDIIILNNILTYLSENNYSLIDIQNEIPLTKIIKLLKKYRNYLNSNNGDYDFFLDMLDDFYGMLPDDYSSDDQK